MSASPLTVAAVQAAPVFLDTGATTAKACDLIKEAAGSGARLVVFPETFIPCYPDWVWVIPPGVRGALLAEMNATLIQRSVTVPDDTTRALCRAAKKAKVYVAMGVNERNAEASGSSVYNTLLYIDDNGEIIGRHRKLMPTFAERLVWGQGNGGTLTVHDTPIGKIGGLVCWENFMPLARTALYAQGVQIYTAPTWDHGEAWLVTMRHIAKEGGMFVVGCCQAIRMDEIPDRYEFKGLYPEGREWINRGNSCIVNPKGDFIAGPLAEKQEILLAEVDLAQIAEAKTRFDVAGHYARPDVFRFSVNRTPNPVADWSDAPPANDES